jgi:hypothetical protein
MKKWIMISILALSTIVCNLTTPQQPPTLAVDPASTIVAAASATAEAQATSTLETTSTPAPDAGIDVPPFPKTGTITGQLSYPADSMPAMRIAAFTVGTGEVSYMDTTAGQSTYSFELPAGTYHIVAYSIASGAFPGGVPSGYTRAVLCGLAPECADHTLIEVTVTAGEILRDVNPGDAYAPEGTFPPMPGEQ